MTNTEDTNVEEVEVDSLAEEVDETLTAPAVEPTADQQEEHDASLGAEDTSAEESDTTEVSDVEDDISDINLDKALTTEERDRLKEATFCGPEKTYPVLDEAHAKAVLSRAKQYASDELYEKIKLSICHKAADSGWDLSVCLEEDAWTDELKQEAIDREALVMGWETEEDSQLKKSHDEAMAKIFELEGSLNKVLNALAKTSDSEILEKDDVKLADKLEWFDTISNTDEQNEDSVIEDMNVIIDNPSIASSDETSTPSESAGTKSLGSFEKKIVDNYNKILNLDGEAAAEAYFYSKKQYLRRSFHPKNY